MHPEDTARVEAALAEDLGAGDWTSECTVAADCAVTARILAKAPGVLAGIELAAYAFRALSSACTVEHLPDGTLLERGTVVLTVHGPARAVLAAERVALNFLQRLSGIATLTRQFADAVQGTGAVISDTRKTTPGWRRLEKYAVRCGGGTNHRARLDEMLLVKENHIQAAGSVEQATAAAMRMGRERGVPVEIEVRTRAEFDAVLPHAPDRILLDHWSPADVAQAVQARGARRTPRLEVSGNLSLATVGEYARAGADILSVGALTHSAPALDLSLLVEGLEA